jgi:Asp-tRNA(Asn)/Glu-tRNA(Gln) amidotransferase A subunit family amidase
MSNELWRHSATELAELIRKKDVSSREVVESHLNRIEAVNPAVSVPMGVHDGLPLGVQVYADRWREDLCLAAAQLIEDEVGLICPIDPVT